ncbi:unannotated protein [freshwater metagenome]|uniref:Unannotated protein n=1 Tax=freshwater metagenome TaxID=449393 RepID=A0A6J6DG79_9ZZZZ
MSGTTAFLNLPMRASKALRPSKNTTSSPRSSTSLFTAAGLRCLPPLVMPDFSTMISSGVVKATSSLRFLTDRRGKSLPVPSDHLKSILPKPGNSLVARTYFLRSDILPPRVPLMPCFETMMRPFRFSDSQRVFCQSFIAIGSATGAKP